jgi:hypothetical protein
MGAMWIRPDPVLPALHDALDRLGDRHPWERAVTMQCLAQATGDLAGALRWGRASAALFRSVGDLMYAANTLFIMAQRSIYAGIADDEVYAWLTESRALAEAAGSDEDETHATVGFAQLAWLRGDHDGAARLMAGCLPVLRRLGDQRCTGRALYVLGRHAYDHGRLPHAEELLRASVEAGALAGQSYVLVNALETLAAVCHARNRPRHAAVLLGTAHAARESATAHMRPAEQPEQDLRESLVGALGVAEFDAARHTGERLSASQALQRTSSEGRD